MPFKVAADPGKMRHTFTGIKPTFKNLHIHLILSQCFVPMRQEMMRRPEVASESGMGDSLRTLIFEDIECWAKYIRKYQAGDALDPGITLQQRRDRRKQFSDRILDVGEDFETITRDPEATHMDRILPPGTATPTTLTFDYKGEVNTDFAQPTPDRVQHPVLRALVVASDYLAVEMTRSHSSDLEATIISEEAVIWLAALSDMYRILDDYDPNTFPFHPTATSGNEKEQFWNADGQNDPPISQGDAPGEARGTNRTTRGGTTPIR